MRLETRELIRQIGMPCGLFDPRWFMIGISEHGARGFWLRMGLATAVVVIVMLGSSWWLLPHN